MLTRLLVLVASLVGMVLSGSVSASCVSTPGAISLPGVNLKFQSIKDGNALISKEWHSFEGVATISCSGTPGSSDRLLIGVSGRGLEVYRLEGDLYQAIETSLAGVRLLMAGKIDDGGWEAITWYGDAMMKSFTYPASGKQTFSLAVRYRVLALNKLTPGNYAFNRSVGKIAVVQEDGGKVADVTSYGSTLAVNNASCTLVAPKTVVLNKTYLALIPSVESSLIGANFSISVSCPAAYAPYKVLYAMSDVNTPSNTSDRLSIAVGEGAAKGISLQVLDDGVPVKFNPPDTAAVPTTGFGMMSASGGSLSRQLSVRYIRTEKNATPGSINAGASVVLSYD